MKPLKPLTPFPQATDEDQPIGWGGSDFTGWQDNGVVVSKPKPVKKPKMKKQFYSIAKRLGATISKYESWREAGRGGLQVFSIEVKLDGRVWIFTDSYFHLSGDAPKVVAQFEYELNQKLNYGK